MNEALVLEVGRHSIQVALMVALPLLAVSLVIGLAISLFQVATSLQDVTLTFVPKILAVGVTLILAGTWMLTVLIEFTRQLFESMPQAIG